LAASASGLHEGKRGGIFAAIETPGWLEARRAVAGVNAAGWWHANAEADQHHQNKENEA